MFNFIGFILGAPLAFAKKFVKSPIGILFYGLVSKWYIISMSLMVIVLYWIISGLIKAGVLDTAYRSFIDASKQIKGFAQQCTPLIKDINAFVKCMMDTPEYSGDKTANSFEADLQKDIDKYEANPIDNKKNNLLSPYDIFYERQGQGAFPKSNQAQPSPQHDHVAGE